MSQEGERTECETQKEHHSEPCVCAQCGDTITDYDGVSLCCGELSSGKETVERCPAVFCLRCTTVSPSEVCPVCHTSRLTIEPPTKRQACFNDFPEPQDKTTETETKTEMKMFKCTGSEYGFCEWQGKEEEMTDHESKCQWARVATVMKGVVTRATETERELRGEIAALREALAAEKRRQQLLHATWSSQVKAQLDSVRTQLATELATVRAASDAAAARLLAAHTQVHEAVATVRREQADMQQSVHEEVARAQEVIKKAQSEGAQQQQTALEAACDEMTRQVLRRLECCAADVERHFADKAAEHSRTVQQTAATLHAETRAAVETVIGHTTEVDHHYAEMTQRLEQVVHDVARLESTVAAEQATQTSLETTVEGIHQDTLPHLQQRCGALVKAVELLDHQRAYLERAAAERAADCKVLTLHSSIAGTAILQLNNQRLHMVPPVLSGCHVINQLGLENNRITTLPNWLGQLSTLQILRLDNNRLTHLPPCLSKLSALHELSLCGNNLSTPDAFPQVLGKLPNLKLIALSACKLKTIPDFLLQPSVSSSLVWLFLDDNTLDFSKLPEPLFNAPQLHALFLGGSNPCAASFVGTALANGTIIGSQLQHPPHVPLADVLHSLDAQRTPQAQVSKPFHPHSSLESVSTPLRH